MSRSIIRSTLRFPELHDSSDHARFSTTVTPTLITVSPNPRYAGQSEFVFEGDFQQADDGSISGTITGFAEINLIFRNVQEQPLPDIDIAVSVFSFPPIEPNFLTLVNQITDLNVDVDHYVAANTVGREAVFDLIFGEDDIVDLDRSFNGFEAFNAGAGNDNVSGGVKNDSVFGAAGDDILLGNLGDDTLLGGDGDDSLFGDDGTDLLVGGPGDDYLGWSEGADTLDGGAGDDTLHASIETDVLIGGPGNDLIVPALEFTVVETPVSGEVSFDDGTTVQLNGTTNEVRDILPLSTILYDDDLAHYRIVVDATDEAFSIIHNVPDGDGNDTIAARAKLQFRDGALDLTDTWTAQDIESGAVRDLIELYIAHFDRAPDAVGLHFWAARVVEGATLSEVAEHFFTSLEAGALELDDASDIQFLINSYRNVLGRDPDLDGANFWEDLLASGEVSRPDFILQLLHGVRATPQDASDAFLERQARDQAYLDAKVDIGVYFALINGLNDARDAFDVLEDLDGTMDRLMAAKANVDTLALQAAGQDDAAFVIQLLGVIDDPFSL